MANVVLNNGVFIDENLVKSAMLSLKYLKKNKNTRIAFYKLVMMCRGKSQELSKDEEDILIRCGMFNNDSGIPKSLLNTVLCGVEGDDIEKMIFVSPYRLFPKDLFDKIS